MSLLLHSLVPRAELELISRRPGVGATMAARAGSLPWVLGCGLGVTGSAGQGASLSCFCRLMAALLASTAASSVPELQALRRLHALTPAFMEPSSSPRSRPSPCLAFPRGAAVPRAEPEVVVQQAHVHRSCSEPCSLASCRFFPFPSVVRTPCSYILPSCRPLRSYGDLQRPSQCACFAW